MNLLSINQTKEIFNNINYKFSSKETNKFIDENFDATKFTGPKGKVLIARTNQCLHRASIPKNGRTRDLLTFYVTCSSIYRKQIDLFDNCNFEQFYGPKRILLR